MIIFQEESKDRQDAKVNWAVVVVIYRWCVIITIIAIIIIIIIIITIKHRTTYKGFISQYQVLYLVPYQVG